MRRPSFGLQAHQSYDNRIVGKTNFEDCNDTNQVGDTSNRNVVKKKRYKLQEGNSLMLESYSGAHRGADYANAAGEGPSLENISGNNTVVGPRLARNKKQKNVNKRAAAAQIPAVCPATR